jgi:S1-C subfamily serine protease
LGYKLATGNGVKKDHVEAVKWFRRAAEQGDAVASANLGVAFEFGNGVTVDFGEAARWYRRSAELGLAGGQKAFAQMLNEGRGVAKDPVEAAKWCRLAAEQGNAAAQNNLGVMYTAGVGVLKDEVEALAWFNVSAVTGQESAIKNREELERKLGPQLARAAQQRGKELLKGIAARNAARESERGAERQVDLAAEFLPPRPRSSGTGAIVSRAGHVLTAAHIVTGSARIEVVTAIDTTTAEVVRIDEANDLAVLKIAGSAIDALPVAASRGVRLGQNVATIGFPNVGIQGFSPKVTRGEISSLNGIADDPRGWQISVPVQPGNSGGPLLDEFGNLIGVVHAKLSVKAAQATGDLPQNVSYAVKSAYALALLDPYLDAASASPAQPKSKPSFEDMVAKAQKSVVLVLVY